MTTLIAVYNNTGCVGRCDARCYEAKSKTCHCICGGRNHSAGFSCAEANTAEMVGLKREDRERFAAANGFNPDDLKVVDRVAMPSAYQARKAALRLLREPELPLEAER